MTFPSRGTRARMLPITAKALRRAIAVLKEGGLVVFPTDTLYALGAGAFLTESLERLFVAKERPRDKPIPLLLASSDQLPQVASDVPAVAWRLAEAFWPGALTLVVRKGPQVPALVTGGTDTVAVRVPQHPVAEELLRSVGMPLTGTSANRSEQPPPATAQEAWAQLGDRVDLILDGGTCLHGIASTIVDVTGPDPRVLREGAIPQEALEAVLRLETRP